MAQRYCDACYLACQPCSWHRLVTSDVRIRTMFVPATQDLLDYLASETTLLPAPLSFDTGKLHPSDARKPLLLNSRCVHAGIQDNVVDSSKLACTPTSKLTTNTTISLAGDDDSVFAPALVQAEPLLQSSIDELDGNVFVKFNGKAPSDAAWASDSGLRVTNTSQLFTLLKASDLAREARLRMDTALISEIKTSDVIAPVCHHLSLQRCRVVHRSQEFRTWVRDGRVAGICQRHPSETFADLDDFNKQAHISAAIQRFYNESLRNCIMIPAFAFDCYVRPRQSAGATHEIDDDVTGSTPAPVGLDYKVTLMDLSPADDSTDTLLFDWEELYPGYVVADEVAGGGGSGRRIRLPCGHDQSVKPASPPPSTDAAIDPTIPFRVSTSSAISFPPLAAHSLPDDFFHAAAAAVEQQAGAAAGMAPTATAAHSASSPASAPAAQQSELERLAAALSGAGGNTSGGQLPKGWEGMIDRLHEMGLFQRPGDDSSSDGSDADEDAGR